MLDSQWLLDLFLSWCKASMLFDVGLLVPGMPYFSAPGGGKNPGLVESMAPSAFFLQA